MIFVIHKSLVVAEHEEEKDIEEEEADEMDEGRRRGSGANNVTRASQSVRNRLSAHEKYVARGDDEEEDELKEMKKKLAMRRMGKSLKSELEILLVQ